MAHQLSLTLLVKAASSVVARGQLRCPGQLRRPEVICPVYHRYPSLELEGVTIELALPEHTKSILAAADFGTEAETAVAVNPT